MENIGRCMLGGFFVGWVNKPAPKTLLKVLRNSSYRWLAIDNKADKYRSKVVGFVTAISDGVLCAHISLLEVLPDYQKQGIGTELTKRMLETLKDSYMIDLLCDTDAQSFYSKHGMFRASGMTARNPHAIRNK